MKYYFYVDKKDWIQLLILLKDFILIKYQNDDLYAIKLLIFSFFANQNIIYIQ